MIITISGTPGSGKSTVAKQLAGLLGWERIYVGGIRRELAKQKGMTLEELNQYALTHPETDVDVDKEVAKKVKMLHVQGKNLIVEGRVQYHFLPESFKIYLKADIKEAAKRIWHDLQKEKTKQLRNEGNYSSVEDLQNHLLEREENDAQRYKQYYRLDHRKETNYNFVLDTTYLTPEEVVQKILKQINHT